MVVKNKTDGVIKTLTDIWERSVKATHGFLTDGEIARIKAYVPQAIAGVETIIIAKTNDSPVAVLGVEREKIEMLFVAPEFCGKGIGIRLVNYAINNYSVETVTVNEQNPQAAGSTSV